jgi:LysM repeat protein
MSTVTYTIKPGDTLSGIAQAHGVSPKLLALLNKISDPNHIQAGATLKIPADRIMPLKDQETFASALDELQHERDARRRREAGEAFEIALKKDFHTAMEFAASHSLGAIQALLGLGIPWTVKAVLNVVFSAQEVW